MAQLAFNLNDGNEFVFDIEEEIMTLGRSDDNAIVIDNTCISAHHAEFRSLPDSGDYEIIDLGSSNGISINGERINRSRLNNGDRISFGQISCRYYRETAPRAESPQQQATTVAPDGPAIPTIRRLVAPRNSLRPGPAKSDNATD
jgi:pSer/pThr/pTyr-binding forkhead associated (FHA) protein